MSFITYNCAAAQLAAHDCAAPKLAEGRDIACGVDHMPLVVDMWRTNGVIVSNAMRGEVRGDFVYLE